MSDAYLKTAPDVLRELRVVPTEGLSLAEAARRAQQLGTNYIPQPKSRPAWLVFIDRFKDPLVLILVVAGGISYLLNHKTDVIIIAIAILMDATLAYVQIARSERALAKIKEHVSSTTTVRRTGRLQTINADKLVVGDIITLEAGERVPADARLLEAQGLSVNESTLTGESADSPKVTHRLESRTPLANRHNMLYRGTVIQGGTARAVITATGTHTEFGRIVQLLKTATPPPSPLQRNLAATARTVGIGILLVVGIIAAIDYSRGVPVLDTLRTVVTLAVSVVPEDLTVILTITFTIGAIRILKRRGAVRQLTALETLGAATVICTDKTGTLTRGEMTATGFDFLEGTTLNENKLPKNPLQALALTSLALATDARPASANQTDGHYFGSPTEQTTLAFVEKLGLNQTKLLAEWRQLDALAFGANWKYRASLRAHPHQAGHVLFVNGAPDILLDASSHAVNEDGEIKPLTSEWRRQLHQKISEHAERGERLLAVAVNRHFNRKDITHRDIANLTFFGVLVINDPPRPEVAEAIRQTLSAGIKVKLVTGDHAITARAIARAVGLPATADTICSGSELAEMNDDELATTLKTATIFARVTPVDKQRLVRLLQQQGNVVAMTGDGVNDAVALKAADIGIAMGSGKDVTREAADLVLLDNNFVTIVAAIREGRVVRDNIRKVIGFLLSTNAAEIAIFALSLLTRLPFPLLPAQILWINLVTDGTSDIALALEPDERNVMHRRPEDPTRPLFNRHHFFGMTFCGAVLTVATFGLYWYLLEVTGAPLAYARTMAFALLATGSLISVWTWRSFHENLLQRGVFSNKWIFISAGFSFMLQVAAIHVPLFQTFFQTVALSINDWLLVLILALIILLVCELRKLWPLPALVGSKAKLLPGNI